MKISYVRLTIPRPLFFSDKMSAIIAMLNETLPLLMPPINLASTNKHKLLDKAHRIYDNAMPV